MKFLRYYLLVLGFWEAPIFGDTPHVHVGALGYIEPKSRIRRLVFDRQLSSDLIEKLEVQEGTQVQKGQVLAVLKTASLDAQILQCQAKEQQLQQRLNQARAALAYHEKMYNRHKTLWSKGKNIAQSLYDQSHNNLLQSQAKVSEAQAMLEENTAQLRYHYAQKDKAVLKAPIDGTILKIYARLGERAPPKGMMDIADLRALDVVAFVHERDLGRIKLGMVGEITIPAHDQPTVYKATVYQKGYQVAKGLLTTPDPLHDYDQRVVPVRLSLHAQGNQDFQHLISMQVHVRILIPQQ